MNLSGILSSADVGASTNYIGGCGPNDDAAPNGTPRLYSLGLRSSHSPYGQNWRDVLLDWYAQIDQHSGGWAEPAGGLPDVGPLDVTALINIHTTAAAQGVNLYEVVASLTTNDVTISFVSAPVTAGTSTGGGGGSSTTPTPSPTGVATLPGTGFGWPDWLTRLWAWIKGLGVWALLALLALLGLYVVARRATA